MGRPRKKNANDNLKQTSIYNFFKTVKPFESSGGDSTLVNRQVDKENRVSVRRKKKKKQQPASKYKKIQPGTVINISSDSEDEVPRPKATLTEKIVPGSTGKKLITVAKSTLLKTKVEKLLPRVIQERNLTFVDKICEDEASECFDNFSQGTTNTKSFAELPLDPRIVDLPQTQVEIEVALTSVVDLQQTNFSQQQTELPDSPSEVESLREETELNTSNSISQSEIIPKVTDVTNGRKVGKSPMKLSLCKKSTELEESNSEEFLQSSVVKHLKSPKKKLENVVAEPPKRKKLLIRKDLFGSSVKPKKRSPGKTNTKLIDKEIAPKNNQFTENNRTTLNGDLNNSSLGKSKVHCTVTLPDLNQHQIHLAVTPPISPPLIFGACSHVDTTLLSAINTIPSDTTVMEITNSNASFTSPTNGIRANTEDDFPAIPSTSTGITNHHNNRFDIDYTNHIEHDTRCYFPMDEEAVVVPPCNGNYEYLSEDAGSLSELRKIMNHVSTSPNLYSVLYDAEKVILKEFFSLPDKYQFVCFKLFTRLPKWYNMLKLIDDIKLDVGEDGEVKTMFETLRDKAFVETDYSRENPANLLNFLLLKDVKSIHKSFRIAGGVSKNTKAELISSILKHCNNQSTLTADKTSDLVLLDRICDKMGPCVKLEYSFHNILFRLHLLYSFTNPDLITPGNLYMFMRECVNRVLPNYSVDFARVFTSKEEFLRYSLAVEHYNEYILAKEKPINRELMLKISEKVFSALKISIDSNFDDDTDKTIFHRRFTACRIYAKTLAMACKDFTTNTDRVRVWLRFLLKHEKGGKRGRLYDQLAMIHESLQEYEQAVEIVTEALCDPKVSEINKYDLMNRGKRLLKRLKRDDSEALDVLKELVQSSVSEEFPFTLIKAREVKNNTTAGRKLYIDPYNTGENILSVEQVALNYYFINEGFSKGFHCEGSLILTLFFFFFWDLIFDMYVPGTFVSEIQLIPLDFYCNFYENRESQVIARVNQIMFNWTDEEMRHFLEEQLRNNCDKVSLASKDILRERASLFDICMCMGRKVLACCLQRLAKDIRNHQAGLPDLFVWNPTEKRCKFVEVKSDNDRLSTKQIMWMQYISSLSGSVEVCYINSIGTKLKKARMK